MYVILAAVLLALSFRILSDVYQRNWFKKLSVSLRFTSSGLFEGERGELVETITNNKLIPIFWGYLRFRVPGPLRFDGSDASHDRFRQEKASVFSYEETTRRLPFTAAHRGCYRLGELQFVAGDPLFRYEMITSFPAAAELFVYPRAKDVGRFRIDAEKIVGDCVARRSYAEDPFFFRGIRDYAPTDSMRAVNWKATARTGNLKVNEYHTTHARQVMLLLDLDAYNRFDGRQIRENTISTAAFLARKLALTGTPVGFTTNAADVLTGGRIETPCRSGRNHFLLMMREMAKIDADKLLVPFDAILAGLPTTGDGSTQYLLVSYYYGEELVKRLSGLEARGLNIRWVFLHDASRWTSFARHPGMYVCEEGEA